MAGGLAEHQVVGQQDGEGVVADEGAGAPDGVAEAQRHLLADRDERAGLQRLAPQLGEFLSSLPRSLERALQLEGDVEMLHERGLAAAGDEAELLDAGGPRLLDRVLDQRLVDDRQHLLRHCLGGGQEAGAEAGNGQDGLAQRLSHNVAPSWFGGH